MIEWMLIARKLGFKTVQEMLRDMRRRDLSTSEMAREMATTKVDNPTAVSVRNICKHFKIKLRPPGGANNTSGHKINVEKIKRHQETIKNMNANEAAELIGISPSYFTALAKENGIEYKKRKGGKAN